MNLLVDIGNSRIKWAQQTGNRLSGHDGCAYQKKNTENVFDKLWGNFETPGKILVSNVSGNQVEEQLSQWTIRNWNIQPEFIRVTKNAFGVTNAYPDISRLGIDRWLAMIATWKKYQSAACIVGCGTAVTVDGLDDKGRHLGGLIMPGIMMMQQSIFQNTNLTGSGENLKVTTMANTTEQAIQSGCKLAVVGLIEYILKELRSSYDGIRCIISGGNAAEINELLKETFVHEPHIVLEGLSLMASEK